MAASLLLNWGESGGFYTHFTPLTWRVCLGKLAITLAFLDLDEVLDYLLEKDAVARREASCKSSLLKSACPTE